MATEQVGSTTSGTTGTALAGATTADKSTTVDVPASTAKPTKSGDKVVTYRGGAHVREITADQWKKAGVEDQETTIWEAGNNWEVDYDEFTDGALAILRRDSTFKVPRS